MRTELLLIRHAAAAERGPAFPDDTQRPLVAKGERQARVLAAALARQGVRLDLLASSPWLRAWQTATALATLCADARALALPELAQGDPGRTTLALVEAAAVHGAGGVTSDGAAAGAHERLAAVGHEPWLSRLAEYLLGIDAGGGAFVFRKAAVMTLSGELQRGGMRLEALVPVRVWKRQRHDAS